MKNDANANDGTSLNGHWHISINNATQQSHFHFRKEYFNTNRFSSSTTCIMTTQRQSIDTNSRFVVHNVSKCLMRRIHDLCILRHSTRIHVQRRNFKLLLLLFDCVLNLANDHNDMDRRDNHKNEMTRNCGPSLEPAADRKAKPKKTRLDILWWQIESLSVLRDFVIISKRHSVHCPTDKTSLIVLSIPSDHVANKLE